MTKLEKYELALQEIAATGKWVNREVYWCYHCKEWVEGIADRCGDTYCEKCKSDVWDFGEDRYEQIAENALKGNNEEED